MKPGLMVVPLKMGPKVGNFDKFLIALAIHLGVLQKESIIYRKFLLSRLLALGFCIDGHLDRLTFPRDHFTRTSRQIIM